MVDPAQTRHPSSPRPRRWVLAVRSGSAAATTFMVLGCGGLGLNTGRVQQVELTPGSRVTVIVGNGSRLSVLGDKCKLPGSPVVEINGQPAAMVQEGSRRPSGFPIHGPAIVGRGCRGYQFDGDYDGEAFDVTVSRFLDPSPWTIEARAPRVPLSVPKREVAIPEAPFFEFPGEQDDVKDLEVWYGHEPRGRDVELKTRWVDGRLRALLPEEVWKLAQDGGYLSIDYRIPRTIRHCPAGIVCEIHDRYMHERFRIGPSQN